MALQVDNHPVAIAPEVSGETVTVTHLGGGTVYYGLTSQVDATDNTGLLTSGDNLSLTSQVWLVAPAGSASLDVSRAVPTTDSAAGATFVQVADPGVKGFPYVWFKVDDDTTPTEVLDIRIGN